MPLNEKNNFGSGSKDNRSKKMDDYFQLRIPRDLKRFFDDYVEKYKPLDMTNGNELIRYALASEANKLKKKMRKSSHSNPKSSR